MNPKTKRTLGKILLAIPTTAVSVFVGFVFVNSWMQIDPSVRIMIIVVALLLAFALIGAFCLDDTDKEK